MKTKTAYEWALETVTTDDNDILDVWHHDSLADLSDDQIRCVLSGERFTATTWITADFGAAGPLEVRYELALTKRRYECLPTTILSTGKPGEDLLDLLDIGYAYVGNEEPGQLPAEFDEAPGKVPARFKAAWAARVAAIKPCPLEERAATFADLMEYDPDADDEDC